MCLTYYREDLQLTYSSSCVTLLRFAADSFESILSVEMNE